MGNVPFDAVKKALAAGTAKPSFTSELLEDLSQKHDVTSKEEEDVIRGAGMFYLHFYLHHLSYFFMFRRYLIQWWKRHNNGSIAHILSSNDSFP